MKIYDKRVSTRNAEGSSEVRKRMDVGGQVSQDNPIYSILEARMSGKEITEEQEEKLADVPAKTRRAIGKQVREDLVKRGILDPETFSRVK
tara:strand:+ start:260 stop:532 length:273 start_codon:yes stop_codon:yes gene_type:complete